MSKFLSLVNENLPAESASNTIDDETIQKLKDAGVDIEKTERGIAITFYINDEAADEEAEDYLTRQSSQDNVESSVNRIANRTSKLGSLFDRTSREAKSAVADRGRLEPEIIRLYRKTTQDLKSQYQKLLNQPPVSSQTPVTK